MSADRAANAGTIHDLIRLRPRSDKAIVSYGDTVLVSELDGGIEPLEELGLFVRETRLISRYRLRAGGHAPHLIAQSQVNQHRWLGYFLLIPDGGGDVREAAQKSVELRWMRTVEGGLHEDLTITNYAGAPSKFRLTLQWQADFADLAETQSQRKQRGQRHCEWDADESGPRWRCDYRMRRQYQHQGCHGSAELHRAVEARVLVATPMSQAGAPDYVTMASGDGRIGFDIRLEPGERWQACICWSADIDGQRPAPTACPCADDPACGEGEPAAFGQYLDEATLFASPESTTLTSIVITTLERARRDLASLRLGRLDRAEREWTVAAGMPAFATFFGRDSTLAAWQAALLGPELLRGTLPMLRDTQGRERNDWRDEQPGRMLHEARTGPLAHLHYEPFGRYYGAINSSTLFPIALLQLWDWTGDRARVGGLLDAAVAAVQWLDREAREGHGSFYAYQTRSRQGLKNQTWKDSDDALVYPDGRQVEQPAATCEEQAQAFSAKLSLATLLHEFGREGEARELHAQAEDLRERFERAFWSDRFGYYAMAIDPDGGAVHSAASNPIHCIATGIAASDRATATMQRLLRDDLFSGWGIRTLSDAHPAYNPYSYHRGTVWPAEHGPLAIGAARYGLHAQVERICRAQFEAAALFDHARIPECFAGHRRDRDHPFPALYPYTNAPQAWSATTALSLLQALLGLQPLASRAVLRLDPHLPTWLPRLDVLGLRVGAAKIDLRLRRGEDGSTGFEVLDQRGPLQIQTQPASWPPARDWSVALRTRRDAGEEQPGT